MSINITHTMNSFQFENRENMRNVAKNILNRQGATTEGTHKVLEQTIFGKEYYNPQLAIIKAASQISINSNLKETLKYLKSKAVKNVKKEYVLGELWNQLSNIGESYTGELVDIVIDLSPENNIFAA